MNPRLSTDPVPGAYILDPANEAAFGVTFSCEACGGSFDLDLEEDSKELVLNVLRSRWLRRTVTLIVLFVLWGFVWKTWAHVYISMGWAPVDVINNPRFIYFDKAANTTDVLRPGLFSWTDWRTYNHCILTDWGKKRLLTTFERRIRGRTVSVVPVHNDLSVLEVYSQLYSYIMDRSDDTALDLSHYFSPCSASGTLMWSWGVPGFAPCHDDIRWPRGDHCNGRGSAGQVSRLHDGELPFICNQESKAKGVNLPAGAAQHGERDREGGRETEGDSINQ